MNNRRNNEFDEFLTRTVPRKNSHRQMGIQEQPYYDQNIEGTMPVRAPMKQKPLINATKKSGGMMAESKQKCCQNHPNKSGDYEIVVEDGMVDYYCERCAAQLATQGFNVQSVQQMRRAPSNRNKLPCIPEFQGNPVYQEVLEYLKNFNKMSDDHNENIRKFSSLEEHYDKQILMTTNCYDRLLEIMEEMKADHLDDLMAEKERVTQTADIEIGYLEDNLVEIEVIRTDVESHLKQVVSQMQQSSQNVEKYKQCMEHYNQKLEIFAHQIEQQQQTCKNIVSYDPNELKEIPERFERFLETLWDGAHQAAPVKHQQPRRPLAAVQPNPVNIVRNAPFIPQNAAKQPLIPHADNQPPAVSGQHMSVKHIHQILPKGVFQNESKKAFRNLESEEELLLDAKLSPNFKDF